MSNSAAMCREQEAIHLQIAAETNLENVRKRALAAARVWAAEAVEAESHEAGERDPLSAQDQAIAREFLLDNDDEDDALAGDSSQPGG